MSATAIKSSLAVAVCVLIGTAAQAQVTGPASASTSVVTRMSNSRSVPAGASGAHASATAIESCMGKTNALLAALDRGDYAGAESGFNDTMRSGLTTDQLKAGWESLSARFGKPGPRGAPQNTFSNGYTVITVPMPYERGNLAVQVACAADGQIAGFHAMSLTPIAPVGAPPAPASTSSAHTSPATPAPASSSQ